MFRPMQLVLAQRKRKGSVAAMTALLCNWYRVTGRRYCKIIYVIHQAAGTPVAPFAAVEPPASILSTVLMASTDSSA
jgi:hypothetical protein